MANSLTAAGRFEKLTHLARDSHSVNNEKIYNGLITFSCRKYNNSTHAHTHTHHTHNTHTHTHTTPVHTHDRSDPHLRSTPPPPTSPYVGYHYKSRPDFLPSPPAPLPRPIPHPPSPPPPNVPLAIRTIREQGRNRLLWLIKQPFFYNQNTTHMTIYDPTCCLMCVQGVCVWCVRVCVCVR